MHNELTKIDIQKINEEIEQRKAMNFTRYVFLSVNKCNLIYLNVDTFLIILHLLSSGAI